MAMETHSGLPVSVQIKIIDDEEVHLGDSYGCGVASDAGRSKRFSQGGRALIRQGLVFPV